MALATAAEIKTRLGITVSTYDSVIDALATDASGEIERYCNRRFDAATVTNEKGDANGFPFIVVTRAPVRSVTSIAVRSGGSTYTTLDASLYEIEGDGSTGKVVAINGWGTSWDNGWSSGLFGCGFNSYKITYEGGYASGTHDSELAALRAICVDIVAAQRPTDASAREGRATRTSESLGYQSFTWTPLAQVFDQFKSRLDPFRRLV